MTIEEFKQMARSFPETEENPHFDRRAFRVTNKRIFATLHEKSQTAHLKLSEIDQNIFSKFEDHAIYPVPNKFGLQGWTTFELVNVSNELMLDALDTAYKEVFKSKKSKK